MAEDDSINRRRTVDVDLPATSPKGVRSAAPPKVTVVERPSLRNLLRKNTSKDGSFGPGGLSFDILRCPDFHCTLSHSNQDPLGSGQLKERLAEFDGLAFGDENLRDLPCFFRRNLIEDLHGFDQADDRVGLDRIANGHECRIARIGLRIERPDGRAGDEISR